jgi:hypothetical protein
LIFIKEVRQVLAELELISHGATVRFDPSTSAGPASSRVPTGESSPPHLLFRARFEACRSVHETMGVLEQARDELRSLKCRTVPVVGVDGEELLRRQILEDHVGSMAADVAVALYCTTSKVRNVRLAAGCDAELGRDLLGVGVDGERVREFAALGFTERQIAMQLGSNTSTVRRLLGKAA